MTMENYLTWEFIQTFRKLLNATFKITEKGNLEWFISYHITRDRENKIIYIDQETGIKEMLKNFGFEDSKPKDTPMAEKAEFLKRPPNDKKINATRYRSAIGSLIHIMTGTRPDICFAVSK